MENASGANEPVDYANQLASPFFTRGQLLAFRHPPSEAAIEQVQNAGSHDYIPHEYIRAVLDRYIGTGRWDFSARLHSIDKEVITKSDRDGGVKMLALSVNVNVDLRIHARDGSDRVLIYSGIGSSTHSAGVDKGYSSIMANAIGSAESLGLKRAAANLGKAFGFDLKSKVKRGNLPPPLDHFNQKVNEHYAAKYGTPIRAEKGLPGSSQSLQISDNSADQPELEDVGNVRSIREAKSPVVSEQPATAAEPADTWDLSKVPEDYLGWLSCLKTMETRLSAIANEREIKTFLRRNKKVISKLPSLPAEGGHPARDFAERWQTQLAKRYDALGLERPEELQKAI